MTKKKKKAKKKAKKKKKKESTKTENREQIVRLLAYLLIAGMFYLLWLSY